MTTGWVVGFLLAVIVVVLVVILLLLCIRWAHRAALKAEAILQALHESRENTEALWAVNELNAAVREITDHAGAIRSHLASKHLGA